MSLIDILILLIVFCVIVWAARALLAAFAVPEPISTVVLVLVVLLCVFVLVDQMGIIGASGPVLRIR